MDPPPPSPSETARIARRLGDALRAADGRTALDVVDRALGAGLPPAVVHARVVAPAMARIGELWECRRLGVIDEHLATAIAFRLAHRVARGTPQAPRIPATVVLAAPEGQRHLLGLRMAADLLTAGGLDVVHLGGSVRPDAIAAAARDASAAVVGLGFGVAPRADDVARLRDALSGPSAPWALVVGGRAGAGVAAGLGAPWVASAEDVVATVTAAVPGAVRAHEPGRGRTAA